MANSATQLPIRPSSLPTFVDCERRETARAYPDLVAAAGFELRQLEPAVGAAVGTGVHAAAAYTLQSWVDTEAYGDDGEAEERAIVGFRRETAHGVMWDNTSPRANTAEAQIRRMTALYRLRVAPGLKPVRVEGRLTVALDDHFTVSGKADSISLEPGRVVDLKTGAVERIHMPQLGAYSMLARTPVADGGAGLEIEKVGEHFVPRVSLKKPQPEPVMIEYPVDLAEQVAARRIERVRADVGAFIATGDPQELPANPMSVLCHERYCPAWGTAFCREHKEKR